MNLKSLSLALVLGAAAAMAPAVTLADSTMPSMSDKMSGQPAGPIQSRGTVTAINAEKNRITLKHEPIPELNWPSMTMGFSVSPEVDLKDLGKGDQVTFTLAPAEGGQQVTRIDKQ